MTVASATVGGDEKFCGGRESVTAHPTPPGLDAVRRELRSVVVDPNAHPALVVDEVEDAVGDHLPEFWVLEVVDAHGFGFATWMPLPTSVAKVTDDFLLLRIDRDRGLTATQKALDGATDVLELRVAI